MNQMQLKNHERMTFAKDLNQIIDLPFQYIRSRKNNIYV
jgi:hypothetical protein